MPKYKVQISTYTFTTTVTAKNEEKAIEKADEQYIREGWDKREYDIMETD